jgi:signal transduction histidine kinase/ActR/RegA family two-component response regulator
MPRLPISLRSQLTLLAAALLILTWSLALYEIDRSKRAILHEANLRTIAQAQVFAEFARSNIKRINDLLLDLRTSWADGRTKFAAQIHRRHDVLADIAFQVAVIDETGRVAFSTLPNDNARIDLLTKQYLRAHATLPHADRLFISKPVKAAVSGKWTIHFTRPVLRNGVFAGIVVAFVDPQLFSSFSSQLYTGYKGIIAVAQPPGSLMARYPTVEAMYGQPMPESILRRMSHPVSGNLLVVTPVDGIERIYGYYRLPDYGLDFFVAEPVDQVLVPFQHYRTKVIGAALAISLLVILFSLQMGSSLSKEQKLSRELKSAKEQADEASRDKGRFLATMSHEIRTPMNGIIGMVQLSASDPDLNSRQRDNMKVIADSAGSLLTIMNDILDFSKIEAGKIRIEAADFSLHALMHELRRLYMPLASHKKLEFVHEVDPTVPQWVCGDQNRVRQILNNFLSNAFKFTGSGRITLNVDTCSSDLSHSRVRITVTDTGIGIVRDYQSQIFTPFTQADSSTTRSYNGTGLGLSISKHLAELMGGTVGMISEPGQGSAFWVELPMSAAPVPASTMQAPAVVVDSPPPRALRILVADDHPMNQMVLRELLRQIGYDDVQVVANGAEAVDAVDRDDFDLVLMDCQMPVLDGLDATRLIRAKGAAMPVIAMTAYATDENRANCLAAGMNDFLTKPLLIDALRGAIERVPPFQLLDQQ